MRHSHLDYQSANPPVLVYRMTQGEAATAQVEVEAPRSSRVRSQRPQSGDRRSLRPATELVRGEVVEEEDEKQLRPRQRRRTSPRSARVKAATSSPSP